MSTWQGAHTTSVLRRRAAMTSIKKKFRDENGPKVRRFNTSSDFSSHFYPSPHAISGTLWGRPGSRRLNGGRVIQSRLTIGKPKFADVIFGRILQS